MHAVDRCRLCQVHLKRYANAAAAAALSSLSSCATTPKPVAAAAWNVVLLVGVRFLVTLLSIRPRLFLPRGRPIGRSVPFPSSTRRRHKTHYFLKRARAAHCAKPLRGKPRKPGVDCRPAAPRLHARHGRGACGHGSRGARGWRRGI